MRRGKFKVRSRNSMGILVLIVFLALIPIIICLTELREQHFIFQMICESIKEKPTGAGDVLGISILDTILSTISIAVSVWIGLNIYNVYKKEDIEKLLEQVEKSTEKMVYEGEKRKFLWSLEKGEYMYEICRYMCDQFETLEYVPMDIMKELTFFEKRIYWIYNAYENRRKKECISQAIKALEDVPQLRRRLDILEQPEYSVVSSYLNIRESDLLFYKNIVSSSPNKEEYLKSIEIYKGELEKINKNDKELCGYMQNTIGYTYKLLCEDNTQQKETDIRKENKWYHKLWKNIVRYCIKGEGTTTTKDTENSIEDWKRQAEIYLKKSVENNPKGRYHQNLGAYYATIRDYDKALEQYKLAFNAEKRDDKIYNLIGSVLLYRAEMKLGISERFQKGIVLSEITLDIIDEEDRLNIQNDIKHAYEWLNLAIKQVNPIINAYYNYSKACIYDSLFLGGGHQKMNEADKYLNTVEIIWNMNHSEKPKGYLYTRRNYWEANKEYDKALEINQVIMKVDNSGDARAAERVYDSKKRN